MTASFPQELVDEVLDYLVGYCWTLGACSLVCRAWVFRSRSRIFETCIIHEDNVEGFCNLLRSPGCTFLQSIRTIHAIREIPHPHDSFFSEIAQFRLPNVRTLELTLGLSAQLPDSDPLFCTGFFAQAAFPHVTRLVIGRNHNTYPDFPLPLGIICLFPALRELEIVELSKPLAGPSSHIPAVPPPGLSSLNLCPASASPILGWLLSVGHLPNIRSLKLPRPWGYDVGTVQAALQHRGGALHHLDIDMQTITLASSSVCIRRLSPPFLTTPAVLYPTLRSLALHSSRVTDPDHLASVIGGLVAPALECLVLHISSNLTGLDWPALDTSLSPLRFPRLRKVIFSGSKARVTRDFLCIALPSLGPEVLHIEL